MPTGVYSFEKRKGLFQKGHKGYKSCLGKKYTKKRCKEMSLARIGKPSKLKGIKLSETRRKEISIATRGKKKAPTHKRT